MKFLKRNIFKKKFSITHLSKKISIFEKHFLAITNKINDSISQFLK